MKKLSKAALVAIALLLVFNLGCAKKDASSSTTGDDKAQSAVTKLPVSKAKVVTKTNLDQLDKNLNEMINSDNDANNLDPNDF